MIALAFSREINMLASAPSPFRCPAPLPQAQRLMRLREAAALLGVSSVTLRRRCRAGELLHVRIKGHLYFKLADVNAFVEKHRGLWAP